MNSGSLQTAFQTNHSTKLGPGEGSKAKRRALMLHSDPSILGTFWGWGRQGGFFISMEQAPVGESSNPASSGFRVLPARTLW